MSKELEAATMLRVHLKARSDQGRHISEAIASAALVLGLDLPHSFYENLVIVHQSELDTAFSVEQLPVGSQCGW